jgi:hypothetical protein
MSRFPPRTLPAPAGLECSADFLKLSFIRVNNEVARTCTFTSPGNLPCPEVGETVALPSLDGTIVTVQRRHFEYGQDSVRLTLDCAA